MSYSGDNQILDGLAGFVDDQQKQVARLASILLFLAGWWTLSNFLAKGLVPGPMPVANEVVEIVQSDKFFFHVYNTFYRVIAGFGAAIISATALGMLMGLSNLGEDFFEIWVLTGLTVPGMALAMISLMVFGLGNFAAIFAIFIIILPLMTLNMWEGTKNIDGELLRMGHAFHASRKQLIREVVFPQIVPYILAATRYGLGLAWKVAVIAEMLGMGNGVGYKINESFQLFSLEGVLAWTLSFTAIMFFLEFGLLKTIENRLTAWRSDIEGGGFALDST